MRRIPIPNHSGAFLALAIVVALLAAAIPLSRRSFQGKEQPGQGKQQPGALGSAPEPSRDLSAAARQPADVKAAPERIPLYSEGWIDDSGYALSTQFTAPIPDTATLAELGAAIKGRGFRGVAALKEELARLPRGAAGSREQDAELRYEIGRLFLFEGEFAEAVRWLEQAQAANVHSAELDPTNMEVILGVAALRLGEVENCVNCSNESSCIFPIEAGAVHRRTAGSREAVRRFTRYLDQRPDDIGLRWLLNVAYMTLGEYPDKVPTRYLMSLEPFLSKIDIGRFPNVADRVGLNPQGADRAGGNILDDFNNDGLLDLFRTTVDPTRGASLLINRGDGMFEDRSQSAGLSDQVASLNCNQTDFDNDGWLDVLMLRGGWEKPRRLSLLRNNGDGTFSDVTLASGLGLPIATQAAGWADYDNDGFLDLYVAGENDPNRPNPHNRGRLYRNRGNGTFADVAAEAGVRNDRFGKGVAWGDYNGDGYPDLYVSNLGQSDRLYRNNRDGTFTDVAQALGVTGPTYSFACWFWDYDNDGKLDLYVNPYGATLAEVVRSQLGEPTQGERPRLYHNQSPGGFRDVTTEVGLDRVVLPMGSNFGDLDNDGFLDIYLGTGTPAYSNLMPKVMLKNVDGRRFEDVTTSTGTGHLQKGHGISFGDWDHDGDSDIFFVAGGATPGDRAHNVLFQNPGHGNHWLNVKLVGVRSNRAAIGAAVRVDLPGPDGGVVSRHRVIGSGSSFGGNGMAVTIGLGKAERIATLEIDWPTSRTRQTFRDVPIDRAIEITEGQDHFRTLEWKAITLPDP